MSIEGQNASEEQSLNFKSPKSDTKTDGEIMQTEEILLNQQQIQSSIKIVFFSMFLDMMGISVVAPILPYFGEEFGATSIQIGALITSYSATSTISTLIMGKVSDHFGRRPMVLFSLFGTMIGFLLTGFAQNYNQLLMYRFISGLFGMSRPIAQAFVTDVIADKLQRNKYLALTGATIGCAFVIGPGIGAGMAALFGLRAAFFASSVLGAVGFIVAYFKLIESHPKYTTLRLPVPTAPDTNIRIADEERVSVPRIIWILAVVFMLEQFGWVAYISMWLLYTMKRFQFKVYEGGIMTVINAVFYVMTAGYIYHKLCQKIGQYYSCLFGCFCFAVAMLISVLSDDLWLSMVSMFICVGFGESVVMCAMTAIASNYTNEENRGYVMGIMNGASSLMRVIGPLVHGWLFQFDERLPFFSGAGSAGVGFVCLLCLFSKMK